MKLILKAFVRPHVRTQNGKKIHVKGYQNSKPTAAPHQDPDDKDQREWIGVDLDKTLAFHEPGTGLSAIGHPVPSMIRRVRDWLKAGKRVKIFTARAHDPKQIPIVQDWLVKHGLPKLEVTNIKDPLMAAIYDDKAVGIHPNTGKRTDRMRKSLVLKTFISGYTKKDGTFVAPHQDKRPSAKPKPVHPGPVYYSKLQRLLESKMPNQAPAEQVRGILASGGVSKEEVEWSGLLEFLVGKDKVDKQAVLDYLQANRLEVREVTLDGAEKVWELLDVDTRKRMVERTFPSLRAAQQVQEELGGLVNQVAKDNRSPTKFEKWVLPGGNNYREILLALPVDPKVGFEAKVRRVGELKRQKDILQEQLSSATDPQQREDLERQIRNTETQVKLVLAETDYKPSFRSSHFEEPNIVAHARTTDRTGPNHEKMLFVEEAQSDWHHEGKKKGYRKEKYKPSEFEVLDSHRVGRDTIYNVKLSRTGEIAGAFIAESADEATIRAAERFNEEGEAALIGTIPDAPFKNSWHELVMKRMLRDAAEKGYDQLAWITGEETAKRYDLSKQIAKVRVSKDLESSPYQTLMALDHKGKVVIERSVTDEEIPNYVGKQAAEKLLAQRWQANSDLNFASKGRFARSVSGLDLKIGGEWAVNLYDKMIPQFMNKFTKKWGGKVESAEIETEPISTDDPDSMPISDEGLVRRRIHALRITPAMRESVVREGVPMFKAVQGSKSPWPAGLLRLKRGGKGGGFKIDYKTTFQGLPITIENRKGSIRHWENPDDGTSGNTKFEYPYGYIRNTEGTDGDHVDVFLGPNPDATHAYIVHQTKAPDFIAHDEDKCMLGWDSAEAAAGAYLRHYNNPRFFGSLTAMPMAEFIQKVRWTKEKPGIIKSTVQKLSMLLKAQGERWITVHPHGPGTEGQPVKIRESQGSPGTWHVVGGAGGKLNYLRLTGVKSHEEYKAQAKDRAKDKRAKAKEQVSRDKELGLVESKKQIMGALRSDKEKHERRLVEQVAAAKGWTDYDLKPEHVEGLSDRAKSAAILKHHRQLHRDATAVIRATRETLLLDAEARAEAQLGELSIHRDEPNVIGLTDLSPDPVDRGLGYQPNYGPKDDSIEDEVQEFKDKKKAERDPKEQAKIERMQESAQAVRDEVTQAQEDGTLSFGMRDTSAVSPEQALKVLAAEKQTKATLKQIQARKKEVQGSTTEVQGKSYVIQTEPVSSEDVLKDLINDAAERTRQDRATSFLSMVEHDPFEEQPEDHQEALTQHIQSGSAAMLSRISQQLTGVDILPREVVDVLGTAGAAQALAKAFHQNFPEEKIAQWADQLSQYHADNQGTVTEEAIGRAREAYDQAKEMVADSVESPSELAVANELNEKRIALLRSARETLGTTLGELEAMAALHYALQAKPAEETMVSMGGVSTETAIRQLKAIGLGKDDYDVDSDGTNHFALISGAGLGKVVRPIDPEDVAHVQGVNDILEGRNDEDGWLPAGMARRLENDFVDPERQAVAYAEPYHYSTAGAHDDDLKAYIGKRMADGHAVQDVYRDLFGASVLGHIPEGEHEAYFQALERVAPLYDEHNKPRPAESHQEAWEKFSEETLRGHYGESAVPIHQQRVLMDHPKTFEAIHRVIADDPTRGVAFVPTAELKPQEQATLRHVFESRFAAKESDAAMKEAMAEIGEEPEKETEGLFGVQENPEWHQYQARKQQIMADVKSRGLTWDKYLAMHGSRERAYQALQDVLKGESVQAFAKEYGRINKVPLKLGRTVLTNNLSHLDAVNPAAREARLAEQREMTDRLRNRTQGKYASGGVKDKLDQARELSAITDQNQRTMFAVEPEDPERELPLKEDERHTLGRTAEGQLSAMWGRVSRNFDPQRPVKLMRSKKMDGKFVNQQRAVKLIAHNKRMALALGTGSGKTAIGLGAFTHLHEQGKVKRGFYVVPSIVQAQFGSEAAAVLEPGKYSWWGKPDSPREERIAAYKDPRHHMVIATHQALRDDLVHLMANRAGVTEAEMAEQFKALPEDKQASTMKETMEAEGINPDFFFWDEGHGGLNRAGKEDSLLANTIDAFHRHVPYYVSSSADPIKNDLSELYSQLHKIAPDRFNNQQAFMAKYGLGTNASQDVLRRELRRYLLPGKVDPGIVATHHDEAVGLAEGQKASYDQVMEDYRTARKARQAGAVDLAAMKRLSPSSFDKQDPSTHEELAKRLQENLGIIRDGALDRVLNDTDPAQNAKSHKVLELANKYKAEGKPGVIFARSRKAIDHLHNMLTQEGHRVITLTGSDSAKEKGRKIAKFRPPTGKEPEADIMLASDAGATGANLQRGRYLIHYDMPHTAMTWWQRTGRINRLGQKHDVDIHTLATDTIHDAKKRKRLDRKSGLRESLTAPYESLSDDHDLFTLLRTNEPTATDHEAA